MCVCVCVCVCVDLSPVSLQHNNSTLSFTLLNSLIEGRRSLASTCLSSSSSLPKIFCNALLQPSECCMIVIAVLDSVPQLAWRKEKRKKASSLDVLTPDTKLYINRFCSVGKESKVLKNNFSRNCIHPHLRTIALKQWQFCLHGFFFFFFLPIYVLHACMVCSFTK